MAHQHKYDKNGKQLCCTQQEKIYAKAGATHLLKDGHPEHDGHDHDHSDDDGHDHLDGNQTTLRMFLSPVISLILLLIAIGFDNFIKRDWFNGWIRIAWYIVAYIPVGLPVMKEAYESIIKREIFSEFLLMCIATIGAFAIGEYPEGVAVMLFYSVGEVFQTLAVKRAKANIKTLLDQRPDEVTILEEGQPKTVKAEAVNIGSIIQLKSGEKLGLDGELISESASFNNESVNTAVKKVLAKYGTIDVLINNAGVTGFGLFEATSVDQIKRVFEVNLFGVVRTYQAVLPSMRENKTGLIINVSSGLSLFATPFIIPYEMSKFGLEALTEGVRHEVKQYGIESVAVLPGPFPTEIAGKGVGFGPDKQDVLDAYGADAQQAFEKFGGTMYEKMGAYNRDPQEVADAILKVINTKKGERPYHTVVNRMGQGFDQQLADVKLPIKNKLMDAMGWGDF